MWRKLIMALSVINAADKPFRNHFVLMLKENCISASVHGIRSYISILDLLNNDKNKWVKSSLTDNIFKALTIQNPRGLRIWIHENGAKKPTNVFKHEPEK